MIVVVPSLVWFVIAFGFAIAFDSCYAIWGHRRACAPPKPEAAQAYWCVVCLFSFLTTANPLVLISVLPVAVSHYELTLASPTRPTVGQMLRNIPNAMRRLWRRVVK